jgi:sec-independent protein translocase protein TatA
MALDDPLQWVVIAVVAIVFPMYGPKKIPELARSIGLARKEFNQASVGVPGQPTPPTATAPTKTPTRPAVAPSGDALIDAARKLNISTEGKTREEIAGEITGRARR